MNPLQMLLILRARYKAALIVAFVTVAVGTAGIMQVPKKYTAETTVMVDIRAPDPVAAALIPATMMNPVTLGSQVDVILSNRTARKVVKLLNLDQSPAARQQWLNVGEGKGKLEDWLANLLLKGLKVVPSRDSNLIRITFEGADPGFVEAVANAFAQSYIESAIELKVEPARQYARWFGDQAKVLRENVEKAQARMSEFQKQKGFVGTDETLDNETAKLNDLSARLTAAQSETRDVQSKLRGGSIAFETLPEVQQNSVILGLRSEIARVERGLKDAAANLGNKHPQYQRMEFEYAELKKRLEAETRIIVNSISSIGAVGKTREAELIAAIEAQKKKLLQLKGGRDELAVLMRDVETAKRAYDAVTTRFNQTSLESQATQTNISVLTPAVEPITPSFPKPLPITLLMAIGVGIVLGGAWAIALEMLDHRVRSTHDLAEMLQLPVLGVIARASRPNRLAFWRRRPALALK